MIQTLLNMSEKVNLYFWFRIVRSPLRLRNEIIIRSLIDQ